MRGQRRRLTTLSPTCSAERPSSPSRRCYRNPAQGAKSGAGPLSRSLVGCLMRALVKQKPEPGLWLEEQPIPEIGPDDVLVKVHKTGICGTDVHIFNWDEWAQKTIPTPMTVGHEYSGEIAA